MPSDGLADALTDALADALTDGLADALTDGLADGLAEVSWVCGVHDGEAGLCVEGVAAGVTVWAATVDPADGALRTVPRMGLVGATA